MRTISLFSCGAASAVATKLILERQKGIALLKINTRLSCNSTKRGLQDE